MGWYFAIYVLALIGPLAAFFASRRWRRSIFIFYLVFFGSILLCFTVLRSPMVDHDYQGYVDLFKVIADKPFSGIQAAPDPMFFIISSLASWMSMPYIAVLLCYSSIAILGIYLASRKAVDGRWLPFLLYMFFCHYFIAHEMTEIRASVAIPLMSWSILLAGDGKRKQSIIVFAIAVCFHLSMLIALPIIVWLALRLTFRSRLLVYALIPLAIGLHIFLARALILLMIFDSRLALYSGTSYEFKPVPLVSVYFIVRILSVLAVTLILWNRLSLQDRLIVYCSGIGLLLFIALSSWDTFAWRASEVFGLFDMAVLVMPLAYLRSMGRVTYAFSLIALGLVFFRSSLQLVGPYTF